METYKRTWQGAYTWMTEWGGSVAREHLIDNTQPPVEFRGIQGIAALWAEKCSKYGYRLLDKPNAGTVFAQMYVDAGGKIGPWESNAGPTLIAPPDGTMIPNGPWKDGGCGWVEPGKSAPDLKPGDLKGDAPPTETYWKDLCAKLRDELNEVIEENEKLQELLDALRELRRLTR